MSTASKVIQCIASLSRASFNPALILRGGLTAPLNPRFISSSGKQGEAAVKVNLENQRIDASIFMNKTGLNPMEVDVGNSLTSGTMMSSSTGILKQTAIIDMGSRPICLDMSAPTPTAPHVLDAVLYLYSGLYGNPHPCTNTYGLEATTAIGVARAQVANLVRAHPKEIIFTSKATESNNLLIKCATRIYKSDKPIMTSQMEHKCVLDLCKHLQHVEYDIKYLHIKNTSLINLEHLEREMRPDRALVSTMPVNNETWVIQPTQEIGKLYRKHGVFFYTSGTQAMGKTPIEVGKWNVYWMSISGPRVYGPKRTGACCIHCGLEVRIDLLISGGVHEHGYCSGTLAPSLLIGLGEARGIAQEETKYTRASKPFFSQHSICSSAMQGGNYLRKGYHYKKPKQFTRTFTMSHTKADTKKGMHKATTKDSTVGVQEAKLTNAPKRRKRKWTTSYSNMTIREAEDRLGLRLNLRGVPLKMMLNGKCGLLGPDVLLRAKKIIHQSLSLYMEAGGYPTEADPDFKEAYIHDLAACIIFPMVALFRLETKRDLQVSREKEIISKDSSTSGMEEFVVMDFVSYNQQKYVLIAEAKKVSLGEARKQCFLSLKDMWDSNGGIGTVYGFITMGDSWRMVSYDGTFEMSNKIELLFDTMRVEEEEWLANYSVLIDCFNIALSHGGKDLV